MKKIIFVVTFFLLLGCENNINKNMNVNINIKNFKKGHVYLQKVTDSAIVIIDSIFVKNEKPIIFEYDIESPELFYVNLYKGPLRRAFCLLIAGCDQQFQTTHLADHAVGLHLRHQANLDR